MVVVEVLSIEFPIEVLVKRIYYGEDLVCVALLGSSEGDYLVVFVHLLEELGQVGPEVDQTLVCALLVVD